MKESMKESMNDLLKVNVYNTTDPAQLLELKRQEARIMLDIVRYVNPNNKPADLIAFVTQQIIQQLDVNKLLLITNVNGHFKLELNHNFPAVSIDELSFIHNCRDTQNISTTTLSLLSQIKAEYIIPLGRHDDKPPLGWFVIAEFADSDAEIQNDIIFIEIVGSILAIALDNISLIETRIAKQLINSELEMAGKIQKQSLPNDFDLHDCLDIYAHNTPHSKVAGDFYDLISINEDELYFCMADVSGKGIAAALLVATLQANLRALVQSSTSFHLIIKQLHNVISRITQSEHFVTLFLGRINVRSGKMAYINAGHNPPVILRDGNVKELTKGCIPLGILHVEDIEIGYERFEPQDILFLYTDGIVEQVDDSDKMVGEKRIYDFLLKIKDHSAFEIVNQTLNMVAEYSESAVSGDDMSLMVIKFVHPLVQ